ncbi:MULTISPECIES: hypothetical protein [unclassified Coleofasciculus]|uniref:hypothetical protein n=1 Tax=unclassified Coleofasciculus TaxID=2692782 RepID=UPI00188035C4|nr:MULTISPECIES: hypothetical protein [unclassified Coleofasciculus]MBE9129030.1 hypothetical protein [Coleofasciculus sp. LEGE 07081]MBE9147469.1 hypothetical protein [Coleofasciculus sp. LEGE 07092]
MRIYQKTRQFRFWLCLGAAVLGLLWLAFAKLVVRPIIEGAYSSESLSVIHKIILGLDKPLDRLLWRLDSLTEAGLLFFLGFGLIALVTTSRTFFQKFVGQATPETLGAIRILTCGFLLASALWEDLVSSALLPEEMRVFMGTLDIFYALPIGFERFVESQAALQVFKWLTVSLLFLGMIGWQTRFVIPAGAFCYYLFGGIIRHYEHFGHSGIVPLYLLVVLSFTPCGDGLSVDRLWKIFRGKAVPDADEYSPVYGWSRYACWVVMGQVYLAAGLSKLLNGGLFWWNADNMRQIIFKDALNPARVDWGLGLHLVLAPDILFILLGIVGFFGELGYVSVLFSRVARRIFPILMMMMHIGIFLLQNVAFFDLILLQLIFFDFTKIRKAIAQRLNTSRNSAKVLHTINTSPESESTAALPVKTPPQSLYSPLLVASLTLFLLFISIYRVEFYPFTAWQMYSKSSTTSGDITYYKELAHYESGVISKAHLDRAIGAMANGRYKRVTRKFCFDPKKVDICKKFLSVSGSVYNRKAASGEKVTHYEIQQWSWNFLSNPSDPNRGHLEDRFVFEIKNKEEK